MDHQWLILGLNEFQIRINLVDKLIVSQFLVDSFFSVFQLLQFIFYYVSDFTSVNTCLSMTSDKCCPSFVSFTHFSFLICHWDSFIKFFRSASYWSRLKLSKFFVEITLIKFFENIRILFLLNPVFHFLFFEIFIHLVVEFRAISFARLFSHILVYLTLFHFMDL